MTESAPLLETCQCLTPCLFADLCHIGHKLFDAGTASVLMRSLPVLLCALTAMGGWLYLQTVKLLPWVNLFVLLTGLVLLVLGPANAVSLSDQSVSLLLASGALLLALAGVGRMAIRRNEAREFLRRQLWDRFSERLEAESAPATGSLRSTLR
ncbi:hypothetical protein SH661x_003481 [Planctomicrobium sp. SH661]|uniref:hypothetical protein n=1 Tax=Planctomicrobium sp. SH661 TaxID=3448124 RepID=UPI003F5B109F